MNIWIQRDIKIQVKIENSMDIEKDKDKQINREIKKYRNIEIGIKIYIENRYRYSIEIYWYVQKYAYYSAYTACSIRKQ